MSCKLPSLTNAAEESRLGEVLESIAGEDMAKNVYMPYFSSPEFIEIFGDYKHIYDKKEDIPKNFKNRVYTDTMEPRLHYDKGLNKHFFIDRYNEKVFYPYERTGLSGVLTNNEIKELTESIALSYAKANGLGVSLDLLDFVANNEGLKNHINTLLNALLGKLKNNKDDINSLILVDKVKNSIPYINEIDQSVKEYFKSKLIVVKETDLEEEEQREEDAEQGKEFGGRKESFLKPYKSNMLSNVKMFLSLIEDTRTNSFGLFKYVPFDDIYSTIFKEVSDEVAVKLPQKDGKQAYENLYDVYVSKIKDILTVKPYLANLVEKLENPEIATDMFKNQFVSAFYLFKNNFLGSEFSVDYNGDITYSIKNLSEVGSRQSNIMTQWWDNMVKLESEGKLEKNIEELKEFIQQFNLSKGKEYSPLEFDAFVDSIGRLLEKIGLTIQPEAFAYYLNNNSVEESTWQEKLVNVNTLLNDRIYKRIIQPYIEDADTRENIFKTNLFKTQSGELNKLSKAAAFFMEETSDASIFTLGKTKWAYSNPSYLDLKLAEWKKDPNALLEHYKSTKYHKHSYIMRYLLGMDKANGYKFDYNKSKDRLSKVEIGIFNSLQEEGDSLNASENDTLSYTDALVDYIHKTLGVLGKTSPKSWFKTALAADKSTEYQINYGIDLIKAEAKIIGGKYTINEGALDIILEYFLDEYTRMWDVSSDIVNSLVDNTIELIPNYHTGAKNGLQSQLFPEISPKFEKGMLLSVPSMKEMGLSFELFTADGNPEFKKLSQKQKQELKDKFIKPKLLNKIKAFNETLLKESIVAYNEEGKFINNAIDNSIFDYYLQGTTNNVAKAALELSGDLIINGIMSQVEYSKMFSGDLGFYKSMIDYKKRIPATYTDGLYMNIYNQEDLHFNIAVVESVEIDEPTMEYMKAYTSEDVYSQYGKKSVDTTDAQAWITPKRWKFILEKMGKWTNEHDELWKKMQTKTPEYTDKQRKLFAQPLKGVYFDVQKGRPVFLKYSQAVLVPNLVRNLPTLSKILTKMQNQKIDELVTSGGIKVGHPAPTKIHDDQGNLIEDFKLEPFQLNNKFWKLQQDLPVKGLKLTDVGSQIQKNIFQALVFDLEEKFELDNGEVFTGNGMIDRLTDIQNAMLEKNKAKVYKELGIDPTTYEIKDDSLLYKKMVAQLEKRADVPANILNALRAGLSPFGIPGATELFQHVFSSIMNNEMNKIKTNGGGFIQMADFGITKNEAEDKGVKFTPWFLDSKDTRAHMPKVELDEKGKEILGKSGNPKLIPAGLFIPGSIIAKDIPDYTKYTPEQLFGKLNKKTGRYENGMVDQEVLDNIIGYRIPNQGLVSNDAYRILGILPEEMGDTVVAYAGITKKTGSDFDIDKMYLMTPSTELVGGKIKYIHPRENKKGEIVSFANQSEDALRNMLINSYKAILLQGKSKIMDKVFRPLDMDFFQMDIDNLNRKKENTAFDNFDAIDDIETKIKYKTSKAGLGTAVNHTMDFVRGAMGDMAMNFYSGWGNFEKGLNVLDREYSEELSDAELEQYIQDFNSRIPLNEPEKEIGNPKNEKYPTKKVFKDAYRRVYIGDSFMALTNAFVDVANNPFIVEGNWVNKTNNVGFMLLRMGVHPFKINALLNQPIVKDYIAFQNNTESKTVRLQRSALMSFKLKKAAEKIPTDTSITINGKTMTTRELFYSIIEPIEKIEYVSKVKNLEENKEEFEKYTAFQEKMKEFRDGLGKSIASKFGLYNISLKNNPQQHAQVLKDSTGIAEKLLEHIDDVLFVEPVEFEKIDLLKLRQQNAPGKLDVAVQEAVLSKFVRWSNWGRSLARSVSASRTDVEGKGKDIASIINSLNKLREVMNDSKIKGFDTKYSRGDKRSVLGTHTSMSLYETSYIMRANPKYFLPFRKNVLTTFNILSRAIRGETLINEKLTQNLLKNYTAYLLSNFQGFKLSDKDINSIVAEVPSIVKKLQEIYPDNALLKELYLKEAGEITEIKDGKEEVIGKKFQIGISNAKKSVSVRDNITEGFRELLELEEEDAEKLIKYAFLTSGGSKTMNSFYEYIPYEWFNRNRFNQFLSEYTDIQDMKDINISYLHQFIRHNLENTDLVPRIPIRENDDPSSQMLGEFTNIFETNGSKEMGLRYTDVIKTFKRANHAPYLNMIRSIIDPFDDAGTVEKQYNLYYELVGVKDDVGYYVRTTPLGLRGKKSGTKIVEYNSEKEANINVAHLSAFEDNNNPEALINRKGIMEYLRTNPDKLDYSTGAFGGITALDEFSVEHVKELTPTPETSTKKVNEVIIDATSKPTIKNEKKSSKNLDLSEKSRTFEETETGPINIYYGTGENIELSNFADRPIEDNYLGEFKNVESAFQARKLYYSKEYSEKGNGLFQNNLNEEGHKILKQLRTATGAQAKAIGRKLKGLDTKTWDNHSEYKMYSIMYKSFEQNADAVKALLATGTRPLTHTQDKGKWGKLFPKLLMEIRREFQRKESPDGLLLEDRIDMPFYEVTFTEEYKEDDSLPSLGGYNPKDGIRVRPNITKEEFLNYITGNVEYEGSEQKKIVFDDLVNNFGYSREEIEKLFETSDDIKAFIIYHEISHRDNNDTKVGVEARKRLKHRLKIENPEMSEEEINKIYLKERHFIPQVISFETRATMDAFNMLKLVKDKYRVLINELNKEGELTDILSETMTEDEIDNLMPNGFEEGLPKFGLTPKIFKLFLNDMGNTNQLGFDFSNNPCK